MALVAIDGKIHAIGGRVTNPASRVGQHDIYDPKTNSWTAGPPLPTARSGLAYALYQGMIVVLGGELAARHVPQQRGLRSEVEALADADGRCRTAATAPALR